MGLAVRRIKGNNRVKGKASGIMIQTRPFKEDRISYRRIEEAITRDQTRIRRIKENGRE